MSNERKLDTSKTLKELADEEWTAAELFAEFCNLLSNQKKKEGMKLNLLIVRILNEIGMPFHISGYRYAKKAIELAVKDQTIIKAMQSKLYPMVAEEFNSTGSRVERAIRHAVERVWTYGDVKTREKYFGHTIAASEVKPTNKQFIATIAEKLRMDGDWKDQ